MYSGTLINDLFAAVERVRNSAEARCHEGTSQQGSAVEAIVGDGDSRKSSKPKQFAQTFGLSPADRDLGLLFVVHPELVRTLEPGHHLANTVDIDDVRAVGAPKELSVEAVEQLFKSSAVGLSLHACCARSHDCDHAIFDPRITNVLLVHQKHAT